jgi:hypothetical protein
LNKDFRYQLTVIGTFAQAIVAEEISNDKFIVQTNVPNVKVSWQVTGVRHDKYANAHRVVAEVEKEPEFKGRYLHAAEWGQPENKSIDAVTRPKETSTLVKDKQELVRPAAVPQQSKKGEVAGAHVKVD